MSSTLSPNSTVAHYKIISKIGAGGMGEVYLALDTRLRRKVALKFLPAYFIEDQNRLRRFEIEAQAASALNHPNLLTIHEIGEAKGHRFIATEFVDGETLRQKLKNGRVTAALVLKISEQIGSALAAAHAEGIIHRDIKPDNIMLRRDGIVKVLDFGLAKLTEPTRDKDATGETGTRLLLKTSVGEVMGTVSYMSPEQARGLPVDARTDIWSLGVVLYEMLSGQLPFTGPTNSDVIVSILEREPASLREVAPDTPDELQRIISKVLRKDRDDRYQTVGDLLVDLESLKNDLEFSVTAPKAEGAAKETEDRRGTLPPATVAEMSETQTNPRFAWLTAKKSLIASIAVIAFVGIVMTSYLRFFSSRSALTEKDTILLADFVNTTGEVVFDGTLKQGLAVQLRQTPFLNLLPEETVHETLKYMGRSSEERVTREIGREICQRRGLKAMVVGTISGLGHDYVITLEAVNGQTGAVIGSQQIEAEGRENVLKSMGQAAVALRRELGESLSTLDKYNAPIEQATTSSLDALNTYSKGLEQMYSGNYKAALPLFKHAVELDPNFVEAYVWLSWTYANFGDTSQATIFAAKAYALRDRGTELEKLRVDDIYHLFTTGDTQKQREADELIIHLYPNDWVPHNSLAIAFVFYTGQIELALAEAREAARLNPDEVHTYKHISDSLLRLNRFDEARAVIRQAQARQLDHLYYRRTLFLVALALRDSAAMQEQLNRLETTDGEVEGLGWKARVASIAGRWHEAENDFRRIAELSLPPSQTGKGVVLPLEATQRKALLGPCQADGESEARSFALSHVDSPIWSLQFFPFSPDGSVCGEIPLVQKFADEFAKRYPNATFDNGVTIPTLRAAIELKRNQAEQAVEYLKPTTPYEAAAHFIPNYLRGQAYLRLHRGSEAALEFQKILDHRGWDIASQLYPLARLGLARALAATGDVGGSRKAYQDFLADWNDADVDLPVLVEAKKEYEALEKPISK